MTGTGLHYDHSANPDGVLTVWFFGQSLFLGRSWRASAKVIYQSAYALAIAPGKMTAPPPGGFDDFMQRTRKSVSTAEEFLTIVPPLMVSDPVRQPA